MQCLYLHVVGNLLMKLKTILTILTFGLVSQVFGQTTKNDTTFLLKETVDGLHIIFIDYSKDSKFYTSISDFKFGLFDSASYKISLEYLKENNQTLTKKAPIIPWTNWVTLKQYKGQFYAYYPSDFLFHFSQSINDTTFIDWTGEGPNANKIIDSRKIDSKTYEFRLDGIYEKDRKLKIHIIDNKKCIAVFEQRSNGNDVQYYLMIAAEKIKSVPIIVNYCRTQKQLEFEFETPDYKTMLKSK
jgi:hypothetical protein